MTDRVALIESLIRDIPDFPKPGILFRDISPLLASAEGFRAAVDEIVDNTPSGIDKVVGIESRGFIFGAPVAMALGVGFVLARKPGKLPYKTYEQTFDLEYGTDTLAIHIDALEPGQQVLLVDDLLATGGTLGAAARLVEQAGAVPAHCSVLIELTALGGRARLAEHGVTSCSTVLTY
jgi:adenine phosphoribosyltransferase